MVDFMKAGGDGPVGDPDCRDESRPKRVNDFSAAQRLKDEARAVLFGYLVQVTDNSETCPRKRAPDFFIKEAGGVRVEENGLAEGLWGVKRHLTKRLKESFPLKGG